LFDYKIFTEFEDEHLYNYMEPIVAVGAPETSLEVINRILAELSTYDEYHLVYGLLIGYQHAPERVAGLLPAYLGHARDSVVCTAMNLLDSLPDALLTNRVVQACREVRDARPNEVYLDDIVDRLESRLSLSSDRLS